MLHREDLRSTLARWASSLRPSSSARRRLSFWYGAFVEALGVVLELVLKRLQLREAVAHSWRPDDEHRRALRRVWPSDTRISVDDPVRATPERHRCRGSERARTGRDGLRNSGARRRRGRQTKRGIRMVREPPRRPVGRIRLEEGNGGVPDRAESSVWRSSAGPQLLAGEVVVEALAGHELLVRALLDELPLLQDQDPVGLAIVLSRWAMTKDLRPSRSRREVLLDGALRFGVERARRLVEDEDGRLLVDRARDRDPLALAPRNGDPDLSDPGLVSERQPLDELVRVGRLAPPRGRGPCRAPRRRTRCCAAIVSSKR